MTSPARAKRPGLSRALLDEAHGFATWEAHIVDEHGNGALLTWGFGHPGARRGDEPARDVPSLSLLIFAGGRPSFWLQQRYAPDDALWTAPAGAWEFGRSRIEALTDLAAQVVIARLDCALPGTRDRLVGSIDLGAPPLRRSDEQPSADDDWAPLTGPGQGRVLLQVGRTHHYHLAGAAYHHRLGARRHDGVVAFGHATFREEQRAFRLRRDEAGTLVGDGVVVQADGSQVRCPLSAQLVRDGDRWRRLVLRDDGQGWLEIEVTSALHERGSERHLLTRNRAPMLLPAAGVMTVLEAEAAQASAGRMARRFVHDLSGRNPLRTRLENGPVRGRYWRLLGR